MQPDQNQDSLLMAFESNIVRASPGKRFANYLIDLLVFYALIFGVSMTVAIVSPETLEFADDSYGGNFLDRILFLLLYGIYMFLVEAIFKGKSLGKMITGTRAVNLDGSRISTTTAMGRGFSRAVPFNPFSALGTPSNPWHDRWNKTMVIDEKLSAMESQ